MELNAVLDQPVERRGVLVRKRAHDIAIVVACERVIRAYPILVDALGRIFDAVHALHAVPTAEMNDTAANHAVAADVDVLIDEDDRGAVLECRDG